MSSMMGGMMGGQSGDSAGGLMDFMKMMPGGGGSGGGSAGAGSNSGESAPNAKIGAFEVPDLVAGGVMGMNKGNAAMAQAAQGGNAPNAGNQGGSAGGMDVSKLIEAFGKKKNPESNPESNPELSGQSFDNPTGLTTPDFNNPVGKRKDINLGNYGRQSKPSDMNIDWDNLKL